jgi:DNA-binding NarL/FixJ family response regulator
VPGRIVIVDDHAGFRAQVRVLVERLGWDVVGEAADAAAALAVVGAARPDAVLLDVQLPDGNGFDLASRLGGRVVLVSGRDPTQFRARLRRHGAPPLLAKHDLDAAALRAALEAG